MYVQAHRLEEEFPELSQALKALRQEDPAFAAMLKAYDDIDLEICELEAQDMPVSDMTMEELKKRRLALKDSLYARMSAGA